MCRGWLRFESLLLAGIAGVMIGHLRRLVSRWALRVVSDVNNVSQTDNRSTYKKQETARVHIIILGYVRASTNRDHG